MLVHSIRGDLKLLSRFVVGLIGKLTYSQLWYGRNSFFLISLKTIERLWLITPEMLHVCGYECHSQHGVKTAGDEGDFLLNSKWIQLPL
jgi:hypothetical protein